MGEGPTELLWPPICIFPDFTVDVAKQRAVSSRISKRLMSDMAYCSPLGYRSPSTTRNTYSTLRRLPKLSTRKRLLQLDLVLMSRDDSVLILHISNQNPFNLVGHEGITDLRWKRLCVSCCSPLFLGESYILTKAGLP